MTHERTIAVVGATGAQGGGLTRAILNDADRAFNVRALTRNVDSDKAAELTRQGAEVVRADLDDVESLREAFHGSYGAFCVTNFWEHFSPERELTQAKNMAQAAKEAGLQHVVWSTLEDTRQWVPLDDDRMPTLMGNYKVPHFDAKGEANQAFSTLGVPTTFLLTSFYWDNFIYFGMGPKRGPDGVLAITMPMDNSPLAGIAAEDIGLCTYGIFKQGDTYIGQTVGIVGDFLTGEELAAAFTDALGQKVRYNNVPPEVYRDFGFPGADDLGNMFQIYRDFADAFAGARTIDESRKLNPSLQDFRTWLAQNKEKIPLE